MTSALNDQPRAHAFRVLAVDDDVSSTELTRIALENAGSYVVREVNDPNTAVAAAKEFAPDLIIMDVDMPRLDGRTAALLIQCTPGLQNVPILFMSSLMSESAGENSFGWLGPLAKPVPPKTLVNVVENILRDRATEARSS